MGALRETAGPDVLQYEPVERWYWPTDRAGFLAVLRRTPSLGRTDAERVQRFLTFPAARLMPSSLRKALR